VKKVGYSFSRPSSILTAPTEQIMKDKMSLVNRQRSEGFERSEKLGATMITPNQAAARFVKSPDRNLALGAVKNFFIEFDNNPF